MLIHFTQYLRPNGQPVPVYIDRPDSIGQKAEKIIKAGYVFEIEELMTLTISMTVEDGVNEPIAHELCGNGPAVPPAVDKLVEEAFQVLLKMKKVEE